MKLLVYLLLVFLAWNVHGAALTDEEGSGEEEETEVSGGKSGPSKRRGDKGAMTPIFRWF